MWDVGYGICLNDDVQVIAEQQAEFESTLAADEIEESDEVCITAFRIPHSALSQTAPRRRSSASPYPVATHLFGTRLSRDVSG